MISCKYFSINHLGFGKVNTRHVVSLIFVKIYFSGINIIKVDFVYCPVGDVGNLKDQETKRKPRRSEKS